MWIQKWGEFFAPLDQVIKNDYINISFIFAFIYSHIRYTCYWWTKQPYYVKMIYGCIFLKNLYSMLYLYFFFFILAFKGNFTNKPIAIIELYQIMCHILELKPNAHNGTWSNVAEMMIKDGTSAGKKNGISTLFILTTIFATLMFSLSLTNAAWIVLCVFLYECFVFRSCANL